MPKELFDEVDENDNVVGVTDKKDAHDNRKIHRIASLLLFDQSGEKMWMQLHKKSGLWDQAVGGHVTQGETYSDAIKREMAEEIGLEVVFTLVSKYLGNKVRMKKGGQHQNMYHFTSLYTAKAPLGWKFVPNEEVEVLELWSLEKVHSEIARDNEQFTSGFLANMREYNQLLIR